MSIESFPHESRELPARFLLYGQVKELTQQAAARYFETNPAEAEAGCPGGPSEALLVEFSTGKSALPLPSTGSDSASLSYMSFDLGVYDEKDSYNTSHDNHHGVRIGLILYADGSPFVAVDDVDDMENGYDVIVPREGGPFIAQYDMSANSGDWRNMNQRPLTDDECTALYEFVKINSQHPTEIMGTLGS